MEYLMYIIVAILMMVTLFALYKFGYWLGRQIYKDSNFIDKLNLNKKTTSILNKTLLRNYKSNYKSISKFTIQF